MINLFKNKAQVYWKTVSVLAVGGAGVSAHLLELHNKAHSGSADFVCDLSDKFSCSAVALSSYSELLGQPVALWGLLAYSVMALVALYFAVATKVDLRVWYGWLVFIAGALAFSLYLTFVELFIIKYICLYCVTQQVIILLIVSLHYYIWKLDKRLK